MTNSHEPPSSTTYPFLRCALDCQGPQGILRGRGKCLSALGVGPLLSSPCRSLLTLWYNPTQLAATAETCERGGVGLCVFHIPGDSKQKFCVSMSQEAKSLLYLPGRGVGGTGPSKFGLLRGGGQLDSLSFSFCFGSEELWDQG